MNVDTGAFQALTAEVARLAALRDELTEVREHLRRHAVQVFLWGQAVELGRELETWRERAETAARQARPAARRGPPGRGPSTRSRPGAEPWSAAAPGGLRPGICTPAEIAEIADPARASTAMHAGAVSQTGPTAGPTASTGAWARRSATSGSSASRTARPSPPATALGPGARAVALEEVSGASRPSPRSLAGRPSRGCPPT